MKKYLFFFVLEFYQLKEFKLDFFLFWVDAFLRGIVILFFWLAIFHLGKKTQLGGMDEMTFISLMVFANLLHLPLKSPDRVAALIENPVISGTFASLLCRPIHPIFVYFGRSAFEYLRQILVAIFLLVLADYFLAEHYNREELFVWQLQLLPFFVSVFLGFIIYYFFYIALGMISFWIGHTWSIIYIVLTMGNIMGGVLFPLESVPWVDQISRYLPFRYLAYTPTSIYMDRMGWSDVFFQFVVAVLSVVVALTFYKISLKRFEASGG